MRGLNSVDHTSIRVMYLRQASMLEPFRKPGWLIRRLRFSPTPPRGATAAAINSLGNLEMNRRASRKRKREKEIKGRNGQILEQMTAVPLMQKCETLGFKCEILRECKLLNVETAGEISLNKKRRNYSKKGRKK